MGRKTAHLVLIAVCALFAAQAAGTYWGTRAGTFSGTFSSDNRTGQAGIPEGSEKRTARVIIERNVFCSGCKPAETAEVPRAAGALPLALDHLQLVATLVSEEDPAWSFGAIRETQTGEIGLFGVGSRLPGGAVVAAVEERRVTAQRGTSVGYIDLQQGAGSSDTKAAPRSPLASLAAGVREVGEGRYVVDRQLIKSLAHSPQLSRWARIVPRVDRDGRAAGFTLYRIHPSSVFALLGLRDGDAIRAVNGQPLTPEVALSLYSRLQSTSHIQVSFDRRGKPLTYDFTIQ